MKLISKTISVGQVKGRQLYEWGELILLVRNYQFVEKNVIVVAMFDLNILCTPLRFIQVCTSATLPILRTFIPVLVSMSFTLPKLAAVL